MMHFGGSEGRDRWREAFFWLIQLYASYAEQRRRFVPLILRQFYALKKSHFPFLSRAPKTGKWLKKPSQTVET